MTDSAARTDPTVRHAARAIVLDDRQRLLMFKCIEPGNDDRGVFWITPGGGLEDGEDHRAAVTRELREETGITDVQIGPCVWHRQHTFTWMGSHFDQRERFYLVRVDRARITDHGRMEDELMALIDHHWWTLDELRASDEVFAPRDIAEHLEALLSSPLPDEPIDVGI